MSERSVPPPLRGSSFPLSGVFFLRARRRNRGVAMLELALLIPVLMTLFLAIVQLIVYLQSATATQYAAFAAARAYQVYGERTLDSIHYRRTREYPLTNPEQTIAEAAAEKVIFESLLWEHKKIVVSGSSQSLDRYYDDGMDVSRDGASSERNEGSVRIQFRSNTGVDVTYCMPILFPGIGHLFAFASQNSEYGCKNSRRRDGSEGIAVQKSADFRREPTEL